MRSNAFLETEILTVKEVAELLRCSKAHVCNAINGKVRGVTRLPAISMGRRKLVRLQSLEAWLVQNDLDQIRSDTPLVSSREIKVIDA